MERYDFATLGLSREIEFILFVILYLSSTGDPGRIQVSQHTADLLKAGLKEDWVTARSHRIVAKGKGEIQTYWLSISGASINSYDLVSDSLDNEQNAKRFDRLVQWVTEGLGRLLKQIHGQRQSSRDYNLISSSLNSMYVPNSTGLTVLEEVREIIHMPSFQDRDDLDIGDICLDERVEEQLATYVANIAVMCT